MTRTLIVLRPPAETPDRLALSSNATTRRLLGHTGTDFMWFPDADHEGGSLLIDLSVSGTQTIDRGVAENHDYTLTGYTTFTLAGALAGKASDLRVLLRQDGTGSRTVAWPSTITWVTGSIPALQTGANSVDVVGLLTVDDGASWLGFHTDATLALDDLTDVVISSASNSDVLRYNGSNWVDATLNLNDLGDVLETSAPSNLSNLYYDQGGATWRDTARIWRPIMASSSNLLIDGATNEVVMGYSA